MASPLPTTQVRKNTNDDVLHVEYLPGLMARSRPVDKPFYRGDIYEDAPTKWAQQWEKEL
jgi:hypothetical protein